MIEKKKKYTILKIIITIIVLLILMILYSSFIEARKIRVKEYLIINKDIPESFYGLKIVHLSDINYGTSIKVEQLKDITNKVNQIKPDIIVITGDLLDDNINYKDQDNINIIKYLNKMEASIGKYIISGENDEKKEIWNNIINSTNFINLNNTYKIIYQNGYNPILIAGTSNNKDDANKFINNINNLMQKSYTNNDDGNQIEIDKIANYSILLTHNANKIENLNDSLFSLILSGHNHHNQINLPITKDKYSSGYYSLKNSDLYVSSGLGTHNYPLRLLNKPTINVYRLVNK